MLMRDGKERESFFFALFFDVSRLHNQRFVSLGFGVELFHENSSCGPLKLNRNVKTARSVC